MIYQLVEMRESKTLNFEKAAKAYEKSNEIKITMNLAHAYIGAWAFWTAVKNTKSMICEFRLANKNAFCESAETVESNISYYAYKGAKTLLKANMIARKEGLPNFVTQFIQTEQVSECISLVNDYYHEYYANLGEDLADHNWLA